MLDLAEGVERVGHHDRRAQVHRRQVGDRALRDVGQLDRHARAGGHPELGEAGGAAVDLATQLAVGQLAVEEDQGRAVGELLDRAPEDLGDRQLLVRDGRGDAGVVGLVPDAGFHGASSPPAVGPPVAGGGPSIERVSPWNRWAPPSRERTIRRCTD